MKIFVATCAAALALVGPAGAAPHPVATVRQAAYATNIVHMRGANYLVLAGASRTTRPNGTTRTVGYAKRSKCATLDKKNITLIACATFVFPRRIPSDAFDFDPLLGSAQTRFDRRLGTTSLSWRGVQDPDPNADYYADPSYGAEAGPEVSRGARAAGRIVGIPYRPRHYGAWALLVEQGDGGARTGPLRVRSLPGGAIEVTLVTRVPRS